MPSASSPYVRLAQISDLHFVEELTEAGRRLWVKQFRTKSHAYGKIGALSRKFFEFQNPNRGGSIEVLLATGDISTDGSTGALKTALSVIEADPEINSMHIGIGLDKGQNQRLVLPGNHDRYTNVWYPVQSYSDELEKIFNTTRTYPYTVGYRPAGFTAQTDPTLLFFVFDSTLNPSDPVSWFNRTARGRVEYDECLQMMIDIETIKRTGEVNDLNGGKLSVDYDKTFRIALLHHHPVRNGSGFRSAKSDYFSRMENARSLIKSCFVGGIDLILFGHQHREYFNTLQSSSFQYGVPLLAGGEHDIYYFCCPSTSEYSEKLNGFYLIDFYRDEFRVIPYHLNEVSFIEQNVIRCPYLRSTF